MDYSDLIGPDGTENNMGGTQQFFFLISHGDIKTFGLPPVAPASADLAYDIATPHVPKTGKKFTQVYITADTSEVEQGMNGEIDGRSYKTSFKFFHPGSKKALVAFMNRVKNDKFIVLVPLADGTIVQIGTDKFPAYITPNFKSDKLSGRGKGAEFEVSAWMPDMLTYSAAVPLTPAV